jgi:hypothetical protein
MLSSFVFGLRFRGQLSEMFHESVGINLANWADLVLALVLQVEFLLEFVFQLRKGLILIHGAVHGSRHGLFSSSVPVRMIGLVARVTTASRG